MNCTEFQKDMIPFINGTLPVRKCQEMLDHLADCSSCNDELEVYYIILTCVKQLDNDENISDNYHERYIDFIKETQADISRYYRRMVGHRIAFPVVTLFAVAVAGLSVKKPDSVTTVTPDAETAFTDNDLILRFRFSDEHKFYEPNITAAKLLELLGETDASGK